MGESSVIKIPESILRGYYPVKPDSVLVYQLIAQRQSPPKILRTHGLVTDMMKSLFRSNLEVCYDNFDLLQALLKSLRMAYALNERIPL